MPINVSAALNSDTSEKVVIERTENGIYADGLYTKGQVRTFKALASAQQPTSQQLQMLPEGERDNNPKMFIANKELRTTNDLDGTIADIVIYKGQRFKIIALGNWTSYGHTIGFGVRQK